MMSATNAVGFALGVTLLVLGGLYVLHRSGDAASQHRENPSGPHSRGWLLVDRLIGVSFVGWCVWFGTRMLMFAPFENIFVRAGLATCLYGAAAQRAATMASGLAMYRLAWLLWACSATSYAIGSAAHGGPLGIFGMIVSGFFAGVFGLLFIVSGREQPPPNEPRRDMP